MGKAKDARRQLMGSGSGVVGGAGEDGNYSAVSRKLMASMGWSKGKGLGKDEQGIDEHLKARKREENIGLGADASVEAQFASGMHKGSGKASFDVAGGQWWLDSFAGALDTVREAAGKTTSAKKKKTDGKKKKTNFLDDCFEASGGARLGMRARSQQSGKHRRAEGDGAAAAPAAAAAAPEKKKKKKRKAEETAEETAEERKLRKKRRKEKKAAKAAKAAAA